MKLLSWNVNGIRAAAKKGFIDWIQKGKADVVGLQETKAHPGQLEPALRDVPGYESHWSSAEKKGYSGVTLYTRVKPLAVAPGFGIPRFDGEGRTIVAEFPQFTLFNVYFPNGKMSPERLKYKMDFYEAILDHWEKLRKKGKRIVFCGDVNTAHKEIDLARPKENSKISGFLPEERAWLDKVVSKGYVDVFRHFYPDKKDAYSWWDQLSRARERNVGWRIDYFFVSEDLLPKVKKAWISSEVPGSDHCPVGIEIEA